ncbi:hypothetical protein CBR_g22381 [Chara braunii]|uniref:S1 motif domain-containing protein n=1 Tax=Chara braunii TaxID=69332 RepID=A0A388JUU6_CHABU|nr:hypothetical protein CBR_g22381 [Chara braunii]|eukprot:GBG61584.1 hypothetical protein CBR_g22381 [Chara braunii]
MAAEKSERPQSRPAPMGGKRDDGEEEAFPRGGGDGLTPFERKKARLEAELEVQGRVKKAGGKRKGTGKSVSLLDFDDDDDEGELTAKLLGKQKNRVGSLTFKTLQEGTKIWGAVEEINEKDMTVSLPCGLRAFVSKAEASDVLAEMMAQSAAGELSEKGSRKRKKLEGKKRKAKAKLAKSEQGAAKEEGADGNGEGRGEEEEGIADENEEGPNDVASLKDLFFIGQLVCCTVSSLRRVEGRKKTYKRIEASLRLKKLYDDLSINSVHEGMLLHACVSSIEDHGFLLTFGEGAKLSGFLLRKDHTKEDGSPGAELRRGQFIQCVVLSVDKQRRSVLVKSDPAVVLSALVREQDEVTVGSLFPGMLVNAKVTAVLEDGLQVSFLTYFTGTVDRFHLAEELPGTDWAKEYSVNQRVRARILYIDPTSKHIGLSLNKQLVAGSVPTLHVSVGQVFRKAVVQRVERDVGLLLELVSKPKRAVGFVHVSNVSDDRIDNLQVKYQVGSVVAARAIGVRWMDGIVNASMKKSVVEKNLMMYSEVRPGMVIQGTVVAVEYFGVLLELSQHVRAICPSEHLSEVRLSRPSAKFKVGMKMTCRVLTCNPEQKKVEVTYKKSMVNSKLPIIASGEDAEEGTVSHGFVSGVTDYGVFVTFYNNVKGLVHKSNLGIDARSLPEECFKNGQVVKAVVLSRDDSGRIQLSFLTSQSLIRAKMMEDNWLEAGTVVTGVIADVTEFSFLVDIIRQDGGISGWRGVLRFEHLADHAEHVNPLRQLLKKGVSLEELLVLGKDPKKRLAELSAKHALVSSANSLVKCRSELQLNTFCQGYVKNITSVGVFVCFLNHITGLARMSLLADTFVTDPEQHYQEGQTVRAQFVEFDEERGRIKLNLKPSVCPSVDASLLRAYFIEQAKIAELTVRAGGNGDLSLLKTFPIGSLVDGVIEEKKEYGIIVNLPQHEEVVGFLTHFQAVSDVRIGQKVKARVLDVTVVDNIVDLSLRNTTAASGGDTDKVQKKKKRKKDEELASAQESNARAAPKLFEVVKVEVELVKNEYLVVSLPNHGGAIGFAATHDYNLRNVDAHEVFWPGQRFKAIVQSLADERSGGRMLLLLTPSVLREVVQGIGDARKKEAAIEAAAEKKRSSYSVDQIVEAKVTNISNSFMLCKVDKGVFADIHITQVRDEYGDGENPLSAYAVGQTVRGRVLKVKEVALKKGEKQKKGKKGFRKMELTLSLRDSDVNRTGGSDRVSNLPEALDDVQADRVLIGYVERIVDKWAWLVVSPKVVGALHKMESSVKLEEIDSFPDKFTVGKSVKVRVLEIDHERSCLTLTARGADGPWQKGAEIVGHGFRKGEVVFGEVVRVSSDKLIVRMPRKGYGCVDITELDDDWRDSPLQGFQENQIVQCVVLGMDEMDRKEDDSQYLALSLRPSLGGCGGKQAKLHRTTKVSYHVPRIESVNDVKIGQEVWCVVKSPFGRNGCWAHLARNINAHVQPATADQERDSAVFPIGKVVKARVKSINLSANEVEVESVRLPPSAGGKSEAGARSRGGGKEERPKVDAFVVGQLVTGSVQKIDTFGVFVKLDGINVVALCHISQIRDEFIKDLREQYKVGDRVRATVTKLEVEKGRLSLGMLEKDEHATTNMEVVESVKTKGTANGVSMDVEEEEEDSEGSDEMETDNDQDEQGSDEEGDSTDDDNRVVRTVNKRAPDAKTTGNGEETATVAPLDVDDFGVRGDEKAAASDGEEAMSEEDDDEKTEDGGAVSKKKSQRAKRKAKEAQEAAIQEAERKRLEGEGAPQNVDEFEQLVRSSPNSSFVWIKYMAHMITLGEYDKARAIAERALKAINYREEGEKMNLWVAYLNLENMYGNPPKEAVLKLFQRALMYTDQKKLYMALIGIYERTEQWEMTDQIFKTMTKKFNTSAKVWVRNVTCLLKRGMGDAARAVLERSLLSLPKRKHIKMISRVALLEFKMGSAERGRAMMEGILKNFPKRVDLWSVYLDQEIKQGDKGVVRALFERVICLDLPPKRMKFLFKKYLDFERNHGTSEGVEHVKAKAMAYVENKIGL